MPISGIDQEKVYNKDDLRIHRQIAFTSGLFQGDVTVRTLLESIAEGIVILDATGTILLVNNHARQMFGYANDDLIGRPHSVLVPERYRKVHEDHQSQFFADPKIRPMGQLLDLAGLRQDGSEFPLEISLSFIETINGAFFLAFVSDITLRKQMETHLRMNEALFHIQIERVKDYAIFTLDPDGNVLNWNAGAERLKGYQAEEIVGKHFSAFYSEEDRNGGVPEKMLKKATAEGQFAYEGWRIRKDGTRFWADVVLTALHDESGNLWGFSKVTHDITERKQADDALRLSELRYRTLYNDSPAMIITIDAGFIICSTNPKCTSQLGYTTSELEGQSVLTLFLEEDRPAMIGRLQTCLQTPDQVYHWQFRKIRKDGVILWMEETAQAINDLNGGLNVLIVCQDITDRKRAEQSFQESEARFHAIFNLAAVGIAQVSLKGDWLMMNQKISDILGYSFDELNNLTILQISHPDDVEPHLAHIRRLLDGEVPSYAIEKRFICKDGRSLWVNLNVTLVRDQHDIPAYFIAIVEDISPRKLAEQELREGEEKFNKVFTLAPVGMTISTLTEGRFVEINEIGERLSGYPRNEVIGRTSAQFSIWINAEERAKVIREVLKNGVVRDREMVMQDKAGRTFWGSFSAVVIEIKGEKHLLSLVSDIAERKRAQEALQQSEERFRLLADTAPIMIWETGPDARCTFLNRPFLEFTGRGLDKELGEVGDGWMQGIHPDDLERCTDTFLSAFRDRRSFSMEYRLYRIAGDYAWIVTTGVPRLSPNGDLLGYIGTCFDITERKLLKEELEDEKELLAQTVAQRTEELSATVERLHAEISERTSMAQALQAETGERLNAQAELREHELLMLHQSRLAAMGEMIGNIAHQWRQPLNILGLHAQELLITYKRGEVTMEYLETNVKKVLETIHHMSQTIDDFRYFFRPDKEKLDFKVYEMVEKTISLLEGSLNSEQIKTSVIATGDPVLNGSPNEFCQVILNIIINARDAFVAKPVPNPMITIEINTEKERCIVVITDNAGGIPDDALGRIFDPYFTTKGPDKGTGVGLFMSKNIIEKSMGGTLSVRNVDGGAQFRIAI